MPGETLHVSFTITNPLAAPIFVGSVAWNTSFYAVDQAVVFDARKVIGAGATEHLAEGIVTVLQVPEGQYPIDVVLGTQVYVPARAEWADLGNVLLGEPRRFLVAHTPRYRAFVSRSLRPEDRPVVEAMLPVIQAWGFDTHTVGINEIEPEPTKISVGCSRRSSRPTA